MHRLQRPTPSPKPKLLMIAVTCPLNPMPRTSFSSWLAAGSKGVRYECCSVATLWWRVFVAREPAPAPRIAALSPAFPDLLWCGRRVDLPQHDETQASLRRGFFCTEKGALQQLGG
jgi:hypothetical protein